ncbi:rod shape-determining protein MreD [Sphingomonas aracearum]|uniref:Rod shape-determining protein MreD n=2 Tax=Sphingomonas aracearum TaxID=2283317 RepID=A0A369VUP4_9SPHN|nr:rod shape-determining protein MreD [Sphingomonas aracearum]
MDPEPETRWTRWRPAITIMAGSLLTIVPVIAQVPVLPPLGLLLLLAWRLSDAEALPIWAPLGLGLFDDLFSGQPFGCAMLLWTLTFLMLDVIDSKLPFRDFWQDWLVATGGIAFCLLAGRWLALPLGTHVDTALLFQFLTSVLLFPLCLRMAARWTGEREEQ